jgi:hypothetical protein
VREPVLVNLLPDNDGEVVYVLESRESPSIEADSARLGDGVDVTTCISDPDVRQTVVSSVRNPVIVLLGPVYVIELNVGRLSSEREPAEKNFWSESEASEADPDKQSIALSPRDNIRRFAPRRLARTWRRRFLAWITTHQAATGTQRLSLGNVR